MTKTNVQLTPSNSQHHDTPLLFAPSGANHEQGLGQARPNKKLSQRGKNFQELKICGHGTVLALYRCAQNRFRVIVSELLRRKNK